MKIAYGAEQIQQGTCPIVTAGTFDGVHLGHRKIIDRLKQLAQQHNGQTTLITYEPHPRLVIGQNRDVKLLTNLEEKAAILEGLGIDQLVVLPFTQEFAQMTGAEYIKNILIDKIGTKVLVIGYDHRFGRNREGSFDHLSANAQQYGFVVEEIPREDVDDITVSSTKIRHALEQGRLQDANLFLGRPYSMLGKVVMGQQLGRKLGFPTANIQLDNQYKLKPLHGVYAVNAIVQGKMLSGVLNVGVRPTVNGAQETIEVHLLDFSEDLYGQSIEIQFLKYLRREQRFDSIDELKDQIAVDTRAARQYFEVA